MSIRQASILIAIAAAAFAAGALALAAGLTRPDEQERDW